MAEGVSIPFIKTRVNVSIKIPNTKKRIENANKRFAEVSRQLYNLKVDECHTSKQQICTLKMFFSKL
ncbi:CLUMA_CG013299, isoform A [Clunio marinus]|uniref:CLUMA_CG013299, isoform A n=1 Tax=Clunio marinus TaxID=568069 RepID=A0A1J1INF7_9DIPT|nr:CLUMA_CG013299, isoform A [Clunio marinus]